jgi:hypothetical protein
VIVEKRVDAVGIGREHRAIVFGEEIPVALRQRRIPVEARLAVHGECGMAEDLGQPPGGGAPAQLHLEQPVGRVDEAHRTPRVDLEHGAHVRNALRVEVRVDLRGQAGEDDPATMGWKRSEKERGRRNERCDEIRKASEERAHVQDRRASAAACAVSRCRQQFRSWRYRRLEQRVLLPAARARRVALSDTAVPAL